MKHQLTVACILLKSVSRAVSLRSALTALLLVPLAELLWRRTVVSLEWLAEKLRMKSAANVSQQMKRLDRKRALDKVPEAISHFLEETEDSPS